MNTKYNVELHTTVVSTLAQTIIILLFTFTCIKKWVRKISSISLI